MGLRRGCGPTRFDASSTRRREIGLALTRQDWWTKILDKIARGEV